MYGKTLKHFEVGFVMISKFYDSYYVMVVFSFVSSRLVWRTVFRFWFHVRQGSDNRRTIVEG